MPIMPATRHTPQRQLIIDLLRSTERHPTAEELWSWARARGSSVSRGTVYRNLEHLVGQGTVLRIDAGEGPARYDGRVDRHDHLRCLGCGIMVDIEAADLDGHGRRLQQNTGFRIADRELVFSGWCPSCQTSDEGGAART